MSRKFKTALAKKIIRVTDENIDDEELIHALLEEEIYVNTENEQLTFGEKAADFLAKFAGSWLFIISFCIFLFGGRGHKKSHLGTTTCKGNSFFANRSTFRAKILHQV